MRLIKVKVNLAFFLEWFLNSLVPCVSKDISTSRVFFKEDAIMRDQQLELIYLQYAMLYEILPDAPRSNFDLNKPKSRPHDDGILGSTQSKPLD
jgi:hypothetical protein